MTVNTDSASIIVEASGVIGECGPTPLTDADLDRVAAAGSKPSTSGGQIPRPQR